MVMRDLGGAAAHWTETLSWLRGARASRRLSTPAPESLCPQNLPVCRLGVTSLVGAARAFWTSGRGGAGAVRVSGGLVRAVCSAWRSSLRGRRGSRGRCGKRVVRGGTRERRRGPASTFLFATCFRAVGNELQAAVQCECRAVGGAASPWLDAGRVHWRLKGGVQSRHTQRDARMGRASGRRACLSGRVEVRRRVGHVQLRGCVCVGMARGRREAEKARAARVPLRPWKRPRHERGATHCVCVRHTARRRLWSVCVCVCSS